MSAPRLLTTRMVEKVWGRTDLPPPFAAPSGQRIGEIWFEPPPELPQLLVKYLFTSEALSVQVHPSDETALPGEAGKDECWLVLDAQPGACLALGFRRELAREEIRAAALDGSIERELAWHGVAAGDFVYLPAGTVHAIGPGLALVEVQQNSDTTFRLYDYGRPRELHLDRGLNVAYGKPFDAVSLCHKVTAGGVLVDGPKFRLDYLVAAQDTRVRGDLSGEGVVLILKGAGRLGELTVSAGQCAWVPDAAALHLEPGARGLLARNC